MALTEGLHPFECIVSELPGSRSREQITVLSGQALDNNEAVGKVEFGAISETHVGNTGNGAMGSLVRAAIGCVAGVWKVRCTLAITDSGRFEVIDPNGMSRGDALVGAAFSNGIGFTIADGATNFIVGDTFTVTVAAGSGKWKAIDPEAVDGSQFAAGILMEKVDATGADKPGVVICRGAEVNDSEIDWGSLNAGEITTAKAQLALLGIVMREAI